MRSFLQSVAVLSLYLLSLEAAYPLSLEIIDKIDIKAIKSINLKQTKEEFRADVVVQFSTSAKTALKFKQVNFELTFKDDKNRKIYLGNTQPKEILFPASRDGEEKLKEEKLDVYVGKNDLQTVTRLIQLFNLIGDPDAAFEMILSGTTVISIRAKRGWISQGEIDIEDFTFYPTIQREVLFK